MNIIEIELVFGVNPSLDIFDLRLMSRNVVKCQRSIIGPSDQRGNEETQLFDTYQGYLFFYKIDISFNMSKTNINNYIFGVSNVF